MELIYILKLKFILKYIIYFFLVYILFILQSSPNFLKIFDIRPILVIQSLIFIAIFEKKNNTFLYFLIFIVGFLLDFYNNKFVGYSSILILLIIYFLDYIINNIKNITFLKSIFICSIVLFIYQFIDILFYYLIYYNYIHIVLLYNYIPSVIYSIFISPFLYFIVKFIYNFFNTKQIY